MSNQKYGFTIDQWESAKDEMKIILADRARVNHTIPYSELVSLLSSIQLEPESYALRAMLGEVSAEEDAEGRGMLTVVVVHKGSDGQPGPGFFDLAGKLGRDTKDEMACWIAELKRVYKQWS